ncbi:hypothetical protein Tco_0713671 [Tanacetum coccineum]
MKTILKYLRNIKDMILVYDGNPEAKLRVDCYCNAGFETNRDDIKSQTGYITSQVEAARHLYSATAEDLDIVARFLLFQDTGQLPITTTNPETLFLVTGQFAQSASKKAFKVKLLNETS